MKTVFITMGIVEGSVAAGSNGIWPPTMTRCECAEVSFDEIARRIREEGLSLEEISERTGCGRTCTACLSDLRSHLRQHR